MRKKPGFRTQLIIGLIACISFFSCKEDIPVETSEIIESKDKGEIDGEDTRDTMKLVKPYSSDSIFVYKIPIPNTHNWMIQWGTSKFSRERILDNLSQGYGLHPRVKFKWDDYIGLNTIGSANFFQTIFLPIDPDKEPVLFTENVIAVNEEKNQVLTFSKDVYENEWTFHILIFDLDEMKQVSSAEMQKCWGTFPWYEKCSVTPDGFCVENECGKTFIK